MDFFGASKKIALGLLALLPKTTSSQSNSNSWVSLQGRLNEKDAGVSITFADDGSIIASGNHNRGHPNYDGEVIVLNSDGELTSNIQVAAGTSTYFQGSAWYNETAFSTGHIIKEGITHGFLCGTTLNGTLLNSFELSGLPEATEFSGILASSDNTLVLAGKDAVVMSIYPNGTSKFRYQYPISDTVSLTAILETDDKNYVTSGFISRSPSESFVAKIDNNGGLIWARELQSSINIKCQINSIHKKNDILFAVGNLDNNGVILQLNATTGSTLNVTTLEGSSTTSFFSGSFVDNQFVAAGFSLTSSPGSRGSIVFNGQDVEMLAGTQLDFFKAAATDKKGQVVNTGTTRSYNGDFNKDKFMTVKFGPDFTLDDSDIPSGLSFYSVTNDFTINYNAGIINHDITGSITPIDVTLITNFTDITDEITVTHPLTAEFLSTNSPSSNPSGNPTGFPTASPSAWPSSWPSAMPSGYPSSDPSVTPTGDPTSEPSAWPTSYPTSEPSGYPTSEPSELPSGSPTAGPSAWPTSEPSSEPSSNPTWIPSAGPTGEPTWLPTGDPTSEPSAWPTSYPTSEPSGYPTSEPSELPSGYPTAGPTGWPTSEPTSEPSSNPTWIPSAGPTGEPTWLPTGDPTSEPSAWPTSYPTSEPSGYPTSEPSELPSGYPTAGPTGWPTSEPTSEPSSNPTWIPSAGPTGEPTWLPTGDPTSEPSAWPTSYPTSEPSGYPTSEPSELPSGYPTAGPTGWPTSEPTSEPSSNPTWIPSAGPTGEPTWLPTGDPTAEPSAWPTSYPTSEPSGYPTSEPSGYPTSEPSELPSGYPTAGPSAWPTSYPTSEPSGYPTSEPSELPSGYPTAGPTGWPTSEPTSEPSSNPTWIPSAGPTGEPTWLPTGDPTSEPSAWPSTSIPTLDAVLDWSAMIGDSRIKNYAYDLVSLNDKIIACGATYSTQTEASCFFFHKFTGELLSSYTMPSWTKNVAIDTLDDHLVLLGDAENGPMLSKFDVDHHALSWVQSLPKLNVKFLDVASNQDKQSMIAAGYDWLTGKMIATALNTTSGALLWGNTYAHTMHRIKAESLVPSPHDDTTYMLGRGTDNRGYGTNIYTLHLNPNGDVISTRTLTRPKDVGIQVNVGTSLAIEPTTQNPVVVGNLLHTDQRGFDALIARMSDTTLSWALELSGAGDDRLTHVLIQDDAIFAAGYSTSFDQSSADVMVVKLSLDGDILKAVRLSNAANTHDTCSGMTWVKGGIRIAINSASGGDGVALLFLDQANLSPGDLPPGFSWHEDMLNILSVRTSDLIMSSETSITNSPWTSNFIPGNQTLVSSQTHQRWPAYPTSSPSSAPNAEPSSRPTSSPSLQQSQAFTAMPTSETTSETTSQTTQTHTPHPSSEPTAKQTHTENTSSPSYAPSIHGSNAPNAPSVGAKPSTSPPSVPTTLQPTSTERQPSIQPSQTPSAHSGASAPRPSEQPTYTKPVNSVPPSFAPSQDDVPQPTIRPHKGASTAGHHTNVTEVVWYGFLTLMGIVNLYIFRDVIEDCMSMDLSRRKVKPENMKPKVELEHDDIEKQIHPASEQKQSIRFFDSNKVQPENEVALQSIASIGFIDFLSRRSDFNFDDPIKHEDLTDFASYLRESDTLMHYGLSHACTEEAVEKILSILKKDFMDDSQSNTF
ncbi:MAG: hypothetical protein P1U39_06010 [Legionellaceae bacterium]|nr:hypothetical protein [Legionellaceae bacterium]